MRTDLPKYVLVAGGPTILIACDQGNPTVPRGTYIPYEMADGNIQIVAVQDAGKKFTIHRDVWPVAVADYRIGAA